MPVSWLPSIFPALLITVPLVFPFRGRRAFLRAAAVSASILVFLFLWVYVPGWVLTFKARRGDPAAMYELARWTENHDEQIGQFILWPGSPDVRGGYAWLESAAVLDYPPALYALGVRIKRRLFASALPFLDGALLRLLEQYPSTHNGLSRSEQCVLRGVEAERHRLTDIFIHTWL